MESPQEDEEGQFFLTLGTLNFHLPLGGGLTCLAKNVILKIFTLLWGQQALLYRGNGGIPSPTGQKLIPLPPGKVPPIDFPPHQGFIPPPKLINNFHVTTQ